MARAVSAINHYQTAAQELNHKNCDPDNLLCHTVFFNRIGRKEAYHNADISLGTV